MIPLLAGYFIAENPKTFTCLSTCFVKASDDRYPYGFRVYTVETQKLTHTIIPCFVATISTLKSNFNIKKLGTKAFVLTFPFGSFLQNFSSTFSFSF